jgi:hypothetical protein
MTATTETNTANLEMSLDQLIKHNKSMRRDRRRGGRGNRKRGRGGYGGGLRGPFRNRPMKRGMFYRPSPYGAAAVPSKARTAKASPICRKPYWLWQGACI